MSEDLLCKLRLLEEDYRLQPLVVQQADLREINQIRSQLAMPPVDARLNAIGAAAVEVDVREAVKPGPEVEQDHTEAREVYQAYLEKINELEAHQAYADRVAEATAGAGQTPVRPLATMGTNGGPLLCDRCRKPIVLEGEPFHGMTADAAWRQNPRDDWRSWILGGMVVHFQTNGTLRVYHGYPEGRVNDCCNIAIQEDETARAAYDSSERSAKRTMLLAFLEREFPDMTNDEHLDLLGKILDAMYGYDPGIGINRPGREGRSGTRGTISLS